MNLDLLYGVVPLTFWGYVAVAFARHGAHGVARSSSVRRTGIIVIAVQMLAVPFMTAGIINGFRPLTPSMDIASA